MDFEQLILLGSTVCVMITVHLSMKLLSEHVQNWKKPKEQKAIVIIILMAPIYAVDSYVGLINFFGSKPFFTLLDSIKECYEALVIAKFMALLYSYLNISLSKNIVPDEIKGREIHHSFPINLFQMKYYILTINNTLTIARMVQSELNWAPSTPSQLSTIDMAHSAACYCLTYLINYAEYTIINPSTAHLNHNMLRLLKYWTWQFVVLRPVCSILMITLQYFEVYPSWVSWTFTIILNISVSLALYSLVAFYHVFAKELEPHQPLAKFLCIKGIVFFCFWQGVLLEILAAVGIIQSSHSWLSVERIEEGYQNILVCVEMVFFSAYQQYAYSAAPYREENKNKAPSDKKTE